MSRRVWTCWPEYCHSGMPACGELSRGTGLFIRLHRYGARSVTGRMADMVCNLSVAEVFERSGVSAHSRYQWLRAVKPDKSGQQTQYLLDTFAEVRDDRYPHISKSWRADRESLNTLFSYPPGDIYTTNAIESLHSVIRVAIKKRNVFPTIDRYGRLYIWRSTTRRKNGICWSRTDRW